jgi:putative oxidoreductase
MNNSTISRIGTILYALVIGFFGVNHFVNAPGMQNTVPSFVPGGIFWVYLFGAALIAASISFLTGKQTKLAGLLLALFLILIVLTVHLPAVMRTPSGAPVSLSLINLVKDTGLAGAALIIAGKNS